MIIRSSSISLMLSDNDLENIKKDIEHYQYKMQEVFWYTTNDSKEKLYEITLQNISFNDLRDLCLEIKEVYLIKNIKLCFRDNKNVLSLLEDKGFVKYEEVEYVRFLYEKKAVEVVVMEDGELYILKLTALNNNPDIVYFFKLIGRVSEIITEGECQDEIK